MLDSTINISSVKSNWKASAPLLRYVFGSSFIVLVTSLMGYDLSYLTAVLALGYLAPGAKPLSMKQGINFIFSLIFVTGITVVFSGVLLEYPLVFFPLLVLALLWFYYTDKLLGMVKIFVLISLIIIPIVSIDSVAIGSYVAINLIFNALMAIILTQIIFVVFPWSEADLDFAKAQQSMVKQSENERFKYALNIVLLLIPVLLLFYAFKLLSSVLVLTFIAILSMSPALANPKVGLVMVISNILGGIFAILAFELLSVVPNLIFMILIVLSIGIILGSLLFSEHKLGSVFGSGFSTFLLILGSVTSSDAEAGDKVWSRVIQIAIAVIYVVVAFRVLNYFEKAKSSNQK